MQTKLDVAELQKEIENQNINPPDIMKTLYQFLQKLCNEPSIGLYLIQDYYKKYTPIIAEDVQQLKELKEEISSSILDASSLGKDLQAINQLGDN